MLPMNFNQLYYFWIITKAGSISAATRQLLLNQSTLSQQLKDMENSIGRRLLTRSRHGVALTEEGKVVFEYCDRMFLQAEELAARLHGGSVAGAALLRLGFCRSVTRDKVLGVERAVKAVDAGVIVKIFSGTGEELEDKLRRRACDMVLSNVDFSAGLGTDFRARLAASIPHYFVAAPQFKKQGKTFAQMVSGMPLMVHSPEDPLRRAGEDYLRRNGVVLNIHAEVEDSDLILTMVLRGEGIGFLAPAAIKKHLENGRLVKLHDRPIGISENLWLLCSKHHYANERVQKAINTLMEKFRFEYP
ncbi:MAG: LysR family transcriptional regulator [Elusimicrobia bacterium]|nr:LysR family transcriptional regulator [Elusimicrobiota bacterium]